MIVRLFNGFRLEARSVFTLAWPLVLAEIGWMSMSLVDTVMVGRLPNSAQAIGGAREACSFDDGRKGFQFSKF